MKNFLIWLKWKLFVSIEEPTCLYVPNSEYHSFLFKNNRADMGTLKRHYPQSYKQMRRDFMWRFLVKGER